MRYSDEELRRRLSDHGVCVPPITDSTRGVLLKKLSQLEGGVVVGKGSRRSLRGSPLFDYSSAEEEEERRDGCQEVSRTSNAIKTPKTTATGSSSSGRRREAIKARLPLLRNGRSPRQSSSSSSSTAAPAPAHAPAASNGVVRLKSERVKSLLSHSEEEDSDEPFEDEDLDEEEEEEEESEEEEEEFEEEEVEGSAKGGIYNNSPSATTTATGAASHRFASSTPLSSIRSTASYLEEEEEGGGGGGGTQMRKNDFSSPLSSPTLRKQIASNKDSFGSLGRSTFNTHPSSSSSTSHSTPSSSHLGEALSSLPNNNHNNNNHHHHHNHQQQQQHHRLLPNGGGSSSSPGLLTQVPFPPSKSRSTPSGSNSSHSISKIIIVLAGIFFSGIAFKYSHLRPNPNILSRLDICEKGASSSPPPQSGASCVSQEDAVTLSSLHERAVRILETKSLESLCRRDASSSSEGGKFSLPLEDLFTELGEGESRALFFSTFVDLLSSNPQWGLLVSEDHSEISLYNPPIDWSCWLSLKIGLTYSLLSGVLRWALRLILLAGVIYALHRWRLWINERRLREKQDVFELVEHVLSILATQNSLVLREGRASSSSPCIAINHIRDQLISPQDRDKKKKLWEKVVHYIRKSESRVREGTQKMYGEEVEVWQWIPDIRWGPSSLNSSGPNPYVPGVAPASPPSSPPQWQGSAFSSLNKNVAAPQVAPTTCLKVRHMFDRTISSGNPSRWVWQVKEEILRRCSGAATILHVAVDKQSSEGCVYIRTSSTEGAGAVFRCLHGQWYRGNLVTVKYLREERYQERFPDSRLARTPLQPTGKAGS